MIEQVWRNYEWTSESVLVNDLETSVGNPRFEKRVEFIVSSKPDISNIVNQTVMNFMHQVKIILKVSQIFLTQNNFKL